MEFTAMVRTANGTQAVTVTGTSKEAATSKLFRMGYQAVLWIL